MDKMEYAVEVMIEITYYIEANNPEDAMELASEEAALDINDSTAEISVTNVDYA